MAFNSAQVNKDILWCDELCVWYFRFNGKIMVQSSINATIDFIKL